MIGFIRTLFTRPTPTTVQRDDDTPGAFISLHESLGGQFHVNVTNSPLPCVDIYNEYARVSLYGDAAMLERLAREIVNALAK